MAVHAFSENFRSFFGNLNPSSAVGQTAAAEYAAVKQLIEDPDGPAAVLSPQCFLQGSYRQQTAIHTLHDIDIVAFCELWQPGATGQGNGQSWPRDRIFETIAAPLANSARFRHAIRYDGNSMCIKIDGPMRVEILPAVYRAGNYEVENEPFRLFRPENQRWEDGFAREHQRMLTRKNDAGRTNGAFIPIVKVLKHLRAVHNVPSVSFHIECLLFALPDGTFPGGPADSIARVLNTIASHTADVWYRTTINTPCRDRSVFSDAEWRWDEWQLFHQFVGQCSEMARLAIATDDREMAIRCWQRLLGEPFFPHL